MILHLILMIPLYNWKLMLCLALLCCMEPMPVCCLNFVLLWTIYLWVRQDESRSRAFNPPTDLLCALRFDWWASRWLHCICFGLWGGQMVAIILYWVRNGIADAEVLLQPDLCCFLHYHRFHIWQLKFIPPASNPALIRTWITRFILKLLICNKTWINEWILNE